MTDLREKEPLSFVTTSLIVAIYLGLISVSIIYEIIILNKICFFILGMVLFALSGLHFILYSGLCNVKIINKALIKLKILENNDHQKQKKSFLETAYHLFLALITLGIALYGLHIVYLVFTVPLIVLR